jgi:ornithine carbamoyltransferase
MKHLLKLESLPRADFDTILHDTAVFKRERGHHARQPLAGQTWALMFSKQSTRTRLSFEVGIRELGGMPMFLSAVDIQLGRGEPIKDVEEFANYSGIPTINALTDDEHPCQILADIFTYQEKRGSIEGKTIAFIGDGACNVANSWIWAASKFNFALRIAAPKQFQPAPELLKRAGGNISVTTDIKAAASGADLLYTDVWISMGKEAEAKDRIQILTGYQINQPLVQLARKDALVMHCLPAYRGKEIDEETLEAHADTIFEEAENRLHVQKAIMAWAVG